MRTRCDRWAAGDLAHAEFDGNGVRYVDVAAVRVDLVLDGCYQVR